MASGHFIRQSGGTASWVLVSPSIHSPFSHLSIAPDFRLFTPLNEGIFNPTNSARPAAAVSGARFSPCTGRAAVAKCSFCQSDIFCNPVVSDCWYPAFSQITQSVFSGWESPTQASN